jgi:hypothetical protein
MISKFLTNHKRRPSLGDFNSQLSTGTCGARVRGLGTWAWTVRHLTSITGAAAMEH